MTSVKHKTRFIEVPINKFKPTLRLRRFADRLRECGNPRWANLAAVMRKLLALAYGDLDKFSLSVAKRAVICYAWHDVKAQT